MQRRNLVARMILRVRKLRLPVKQLRFRRRPLIDPWKQIDQMLARSARCREVDDDVAMAVEAANVTHVRVVVRGDINIVVLGPADTFEMNRNRCSYRPRSWSHADNTRLDHEMSERDGLVAIAQRNSMQ